MLMPEKCAPHDRCLPLLVMPVKPTSHFRLHKDACLGLVCELSPGALCSEVFQVPPPIANIYGTECLVALGAYNLANIGLHSLRHD